MAGKGGAGKSVVCATVARLLARRGRRVLALDSDMLPGLSLSLGAWVPDEPPLSEAAERDADGRWRLKKGIGPMRAVQDYATDAPDGVRLLQAGKRVPDGVGRVMAASSAFYAIVHRVRRTPSLRDWAIVGDLPGGPRQLAFDWAPYADRVLLVVEPTWQSILTARRIACIAATRRDVEILLVANKVERGGDVGRLEDALGLAAAAAVPLDEAVRTTERVGGALLDHAPDSAAVEAIDQLVRSLAPASRLQPV